jgi:hypothetical protein
VVAVVVLELLESLLLLGQGRGLGRVVLAFRQALLALQHFTAAAVVAEFTTILDRLILELCRVSVVLVVVAMAQGIFQLLVLMERRILVVEVAAGLQMIRPQELPAGQMVVLVDLE